MSAAAELVARLSGGDRRALARAITLVENGGAPAAAVLAALGAPQWRVPVIGITGPPGAGKSTLIACLAGEFRRQGRTIAVLAVDPSSPLSGGAILGDRIRMARHVEDPGVYIRSVASRGQLGGLFRTVWEVLRVLEAARPDLILLETVGTGQSEVEVAGFATVRVVVCAPGLGDEVQAIKAGVLEIADLLVVNRSDHPMAARTVQELEGMLALRAVRSPPVRVMQTDASTGQGVAALAEALLAHSAAQPGEAGALRAAAALRRRLTQTTTELFHERLLRTRSAALDALSARVLRGELAIEAAAAQLLAGADPAAPADALTSG